MARDTIEFVKAALRRPLEVSTVFPTSRHLAERLLDFADISSTEKIVELGAGTGAITRHLEPRLRHPSTYFGVELDEPMVQFLRTEFPALRFETGLAENLPNWALPQSIDVIVSSLPWTVFSNETQTKTIAAIKDSLKPNGIFLTYICANALWYPQARAFVRRLSGAFYSVQKSELEWLNVPPAYVFCARSPRSESLSGGSLH